MAQSLTALITPLLPLAIGAAFAASNANAETYSWSASSGYMPDQVGTGMVLPADSTIAPTLANGVMTISSSSASSFGYYVQTGADIRMPSQLNIEADLRVVSDVSFSQARAAAAIAFTTQPSIGVDIFFGTDEVFWVTSNSSRGGSVSIATTDRIHHYRILTDGLSEGSAFSVFQDGTSILSGQLPSPSGGYGWSTPTVWFGDGTLGASGETQWESFSHNAAAAVPEPSSYALMLVGLIPLLARRARRRA